ncbi:MAG: glucosamine-fructose-6-phosphate aminotransferase [Candidatus Cloacimonadota bacterium]|nr:MAG: glucosamine-fructose-6-phosphate aminotransferase [Candidatus Cloacimonadota bacterium]PIE77508.1 MAG: glucosamine-fructose-6-phosphate aminotransferase [Candidatus Delongbacteria bacterium]
MLKFNEKEKIDSVNGALALRPKIEAIVDKFYNDGFDNIFFIGIGGTWASGIQVEAYMKARSSLPIFVENAAEYLTTGNRRVTKNSVVIFSSVTGSTKEMVEAVKKINNLGARVLGFVDKEDSPIVEYCTWTISYPMNEQLKFFMVANRVMFNNSEFNEYDRYNREMEENLATALVEIEKKADGFAKDFAIKKYEYYKDRPDMPHYFVGSGIQWGATYSYAMCYWEEQFWIRTKSIRAAEFFHGMFEIVESETPVTVFMIEDEERSLSERVANFLPKICRQYTIIDSKDYKTEGISEEFRGSISHHIIRAINNRIDVHMEKEFRHPMDIRRYYRQLDY